MPLKIEIADLVAADPVRKTRHLQVMGDDPVFQIDFVGTGIGVKTFKGLFDLCSGAPSRSLEAKFARPGRMRTTATSPLAV